MYANPSPDAAKSEALLSTLVEAAGMSPQDTYSTGEVVHLFRSCGYAIDADLLVGLLTHKRIPRPIHDQWDAAHIHVLGAFLEGHRLWQPDSPIHLSKKSAFRREVESLRAEGKTVPGADHALLSVLLWMTREDHREHREALFEVVLGRLRDQHIDLFA